jgi:hypothetical protein
VKQFFFSALCLVMVAGLYAQDSSSVSQGDMMNKTSAKKDRINYRLRMEEEGDLVFNKHNIFGIKLATDGYGIFFEKGKFKTTTRTVIYEFELNEKKSPKENKISTQDNASFSSIVPYKINNFYEFKAAIGQQYLIGGKGNKNGVSVTALYAGGLSLAILKPYFIEVTDQSFNIRYRTTFLDYEKNDTLQQLTPTSADGFTAGWDDLSVKPGINAKGALRFDYGRLNQTVSAIEVGLSGEFFFGKIPQVVLVPYKQLFFDVSVAILFGNRK